MAIKSKKLSLKVFTEQRPPLGSYEPALSPKTAPNSFSHPEDAFDLKQYIEDVIEEVQEVLPTGFSYPIFGEVAGPQILTGAGAVNLTNYSTDISIGSATTDISFTLANSTLKGLVKVITLTAVGASGRALITLTNSSLSNTLILENAGESATVIWNGTEWVVIDFKS
jgi:hypothetical protein